MGLSHRLEIRQSQTLQMTPQLLQAIRLLQLSHQELAAYIETELERNPLLERADDAQSQDKDKDKARASATDETPIRDWSPERPQTQREVIEADFGTTFDNIFPDDAATSRPAPVAADEGLMVSSAMPYRGAGGREDGDAPDLETTLAAETSLAGHLEAQLDLATIDPLERLIGRFLIDAIDGGGYLAEKPEEIALRLQVETARVEQVLAIIQRCEPTGIGARDLAECLALQLRERNRLDPAMQALIANLPLVARNEHARLCRLCGVDREDLHDMLAELRRLDPKPGRAFSTEPAHTLVPEVFVRRAADGGWQVELNNDTLPRVLLNRAYHLRLMKNARSGADRAFLSECLQNGDWLTRSLEQRARTVLKVAGEIVRHQETFFSEGSSHLRPLTLRAIAEAIGMHESTISRVTANKAIGTERGVFPMKYFFATAVAAVDGGETHAAETVRQRIRQFVGMETGARDVLSDDAIVDRLHGEGIDIARRTVAKYREAMRIPSSVARRRAFDARKAEAEAAPGRR